MPLDEVQTRVLGCLIEKQLTTPQQYPLTLNALVLACNQTSNRDPVVNYEEHPVEQALEALKAQRLVRYVLPSHGRSVVRYRQVLDESLGLDDKQLALLAVLALRGPQTAGELRSRTERMATFGDVFDVEHDLALLAGRDEPLTARQPRRPGQKEERWIQLLAFDLRQDEQVTMVAPTSPEVGRPGPGARIQPSAPDLEATLASLRRDLSTLGDEVRELRDDIDRLRTSLGG